MSNSFDDSQLGRNLAPIILALALVMLLGSAALTYRNILQLRESSDWVARTREVMTTTTRVMAELDEAESAGRGFLLSELPIYREQFDSAADAVTKNQALLLTLTMDNPDQQRRLEEIARLVKPKIELMRTFVSWRDKPENDSAEEALMLTASTLQMTVIRDLVTEVRDVEAKLLIQRVDRMHSQLWQTLLTLIASTMTACGLVGGTYFVLRRHWGLQQRSASESKRYIREKDELAQYNRRLLESTGEGIYGIDTEGRCTFMNRAGALILGGRPDDFLGKDMHELVHHQHADRSPYEVKDCPIYKASKIGDGCRIDDEVFWSLDGKAVPVEYSSFPIIGENNSEKVDGAVVTFNDITARIRSQDELRLARDSAEAANESKSQFLANMSHELRTPLNAVIMYSELLAEEAEEQEIDGFIPDLKKIGGAGKHLLELVNSVLDLSKIEAGKMELYTEEFNLPNLLNEIATTVDPLVEKNQNDLKLNVDSTIKTMTGDVTKIRQILYNLLSNACKFTENGSIRLDVQAVPEGDMIIFRVTDSGIGMTDDQVAGLFQPFSQADSSTTRKYGGTGLGLAIIHRFADMMNGEVNVESELGKGTTFTVSLPRHLIVPTNDEAESDDDSDPRTSKPTLQTPENAPVVLVIDDDPSVRDVLMRVLIAEGIRPITASDGAEGFQRAKDLHPDLIILDVMMPKVDGWSVLAMLKADEKLAEIPVVMHSIRDDKDIGYVLGATDYLVKPFDRKKLVATLHRHMLTEGSSLLVVDDDSAVQRAISSSLKESGWEIHCVGNGKEAIEQLEQNIPSVILLDLMMPEMDGFEFLESLKEQPEWLSVPVVVMTSKDLTLEDRARLNGGVDRVLHKGKLTRDGFLGEVRRVVANVTRTKIK